MKQAWTLIELIFVIVIIGLLASVAVPKFMTAKGQASAVSAKSIVSSVRTAIETKHGEWIINDDLGADDGYTPQGYPQKLDDATPNKSGEDLFVGTSKLPLLKNSVKSCLIDNCWYKYKADDTDNNLSFYAYRFSQEDNITLEYNGSNGVFDCNNDGSKSKAECQSIIDGS
jgi:prepilin-type N-terminal cleavage/methylation domain-containing protein